MAEPTPAPKSTSLTNALSVLQRIEEMASSRPWRLAIRKSNPGGLSAHQTTEVQGIYAGFDWEAGKVIIEPAIPLTELSAEQVLDIQKSVRAGGSWHAYQREKKNLERIAALEEELAGLRAAAHQAGA